MCLQLSLGCKRETNNKITKKEKKMIQYIIAAGIGAFLGSQSKKSKKSYAEGGLTDKNFMIQGYSIDFERNYDDGGFSSSSIDYDGYEEIDDNGDIVYDVKDVYKDALAEYNKISEKMSYEGRDVDYVELTALGAFRDTKEFGFTIMKSKGKRSFSGKRSSEFAKGGMMQGYDDRLDESLSMRDGAGRKKQQGRKDRRDESAGMEKSMGRRKYASVGTMDKGRRKMEDGGMVDKKVIDHTNKKIKGWYKNAKQDHGVVGRGKTSIKDDEIIVDYVENGKKKSWSMAYYPSYVDDNGLDYFYNVWMEQA